MKRRSVFTGAMLSIVIIGLFAQGFYVQGSAGQRARPVGANQSGWLRRCGNGQVPSLAVHDGYLYAGTQNYGAEPDRAEIWRSSDGTGWVQVDDRATNGAAARISFEEIISMPAVGDMRIPKAVRSGVARMERPGRKWSRNGFNDTHNGIARFAVFEDMLYVSTWNGTTGTQIWRTSDGLDWDPFGEGGTRQ